MNMDEWANKRAPLKLHLPAHFPSVVLMLVIVAPTRVGVVSGLSGLSLNLFHLIRPD